jgi:hypothetical protein
MEKPPVKAKVSGTRNQASLNIVWKNKVITIREEY